MSDILNKTIVLVLNRDWQAISIRTPQDTFCQTGDGPSPNAHGVAEWKQFLNE